MRAELELLVGGRRRGTSTDPPPSRALPAAGGLLGESSIIMVTDSQAASDRPAPRSERGGRERWMDGLACLLACLLAVAVEVKLSRFM